MFPLRFFQRYQWIYFAYLAISVMSRWWAVLARKMQQFIPVKQQDTDTPSKEIRAPLEPDGFSQTQAHNLGRQNA